MTPSFAGGGSEKGDPDDVRVVNGAQFAILWDGDDYSLDRTWITAKQENVINLEEHR